MNVWYINSMLGTLRLEEEDDALCGVQLCPDGVPDLEPLPRKVCETPLLQETEEHGGSSTCRWPPKAPPSRKRSGPR